MNPTTNILHISNTDIKLDSRIRKEITAIKGIENTIVSVIGVPKNAKNKADSIDKLPYRCITLVSRKLRVLPRAFSYFFELIEFTIRSVAIGFREKPSIIHCHDTFALPSGWILKLLSTHNTLLIYDAHELESRKNGQNKILSLATLAIEHTCWKKTDHLICVSDSIIDWYNQKFPKKETSLILNAPVTNPTGNNNDKGAYDTNYIRSHFEIPKEHYIYVYLGIFGYGRGIECSLRVFASSPRNAHVVFIGYGLLEEQISEYSDKHPNIHMHDAVPHDQVVSIVQGADYGLCLIENVSLSDYYCLPNKLFEYSFAGLPIIASDFPEIRKLNNTLKLGECCSPDEKHLTAAVNRTLSLPKKKIESNLESISWETQANRLVDLYKNLIACLGRGFRI